MSALSPSAPSPPQRLLAVACPHCNARVAVERSLLGAAAECPLCHRGFRVPETTAPPPPRPRPSRPPRPASASAPDDAHPLAPPEETPRASGFRATWIDAEVANASAAGDQAADLRRVIAARSVRRTRRNLVMLAAGGATLLAIVMMLGRQRRR